MRSALSSIWLWVQTFSSRELRSAFGHVNRKFAKRAAKRQKQATKPARKVKGSKKPIGNTTLVHAGENGSEEEQ